MSGAEPKTTSPPRCSSHPSSLALDGLVWGSAGLRGESSDALLRCEAQFCGTKDVSNYFCLAENMQHEKALTPTMLVGVCAFQAKNRSAGHGTPLAP